VLHEREIRQGIVILQDISEEEPKKWTPIPFLNYLEYFGNLLSPPFRQRIEKLMGDIRNGHEPEIVGLMAADEAERYLRQPTAERLRQELWP
jgi:hypothetical protein